MADSGKKRGICNIREQAIYSRYHGKPLYTTLRRGEGGRQGERARLSFQ